MNTGNSNLTVAGLGIDVVYKDIKNLHISVYPPKGRVRVAAPERMEEENVRLAIVQRLPWIKRQRERLMGADRQTERHMISGESHYVWGKRHRLDVSKVSGHFGVEISGNNLLVITPEGSDTEARFRTLDRWYRRQLKAVVPGLLTVWAPTIGVEVPNLVVRRMKTKWGTCVIHSHTIWLNPELAKKDPRSLEYIIVHELVHLLERGHGERFITLMDSYLPDWSTRRDLLNGAPLSHEEWAEVR